MTNPFDERNDYIKPSVTSSVARHPFTRAKGGGVPFQFESGLFTPSLRGFKIQNPSLPLPANPVLRHQRWKTSAARSLLRFLESLAATKPKIQRKCH